MLAGFTIVGAQREQIRCPLCTAPLDLDALAAGKYDTSSLTIEEATAQRTDRAQILGCLVAVITASVAGLLLWEFTSGPVTFWGVAVTIAIVYNVTSMLLRRRPIEHLLPRKPPSPPPPRHVEPYEQPIIVDDVTLQALKTIDELGEDRGNLLVVVSSSDEELNKLKKLLVEQRGIVPARIADATASSFARPDALRNGDVICVLLNPGVEGPRYRLPLKEYANIRVVVFNSFRIAPSAMIAIRNCIETDTA